MHDTLSRASNAQGHMLVNGTIGPFLLQDPSYVTIINDLNHDLACIAVNETCTSDLSKPGFNISLPPSVYIQTREAIVSPRPMDPGAGIGPRIYLEGGGSGISFG